MPPPDLATRRATPEDAAAIAAIYSEGIADRIATFETELRTAVHDGIVRAHAVLRVRGNLRSR